jgi:hypothetical protein
MATQGAQQPKTAMSGPGSVFRDSHHTCCFTKAYGSFARGTGSVLATASPAEARAALGWSEEQFTRYCRKVRSRPRGRGHASLLADLDAWHSKPYKGIGRPLMYSPTGRAALPAAHPRRSARRGQDVFGRHAELAAGGLEVPRDPATLAALRLRYCPGPPGAFKRP